jgi:septation ring formation regulator EzrA
MEQLHRFGSANQAAPEAAGRVETMIADLNRAVKFLDFDIATEEEREQVYDRANADYPMLARTIAARRENLKVTISILEARLASLNAAASFAEVAKAPDLVLRRPRRNASPRRFKAWLRLSRSLANANALESSTPAL